MHFSLTYMAPQDASETPSKGTHRPWQQSPRSVTQAGARLLDAQVLAGQAAAQARLHLPVRAARGLRDQRGLHVQRGARLQLHIPARTSGSKVQDMRSQGRQPAWHALSYVFHKAHQLL